MNWRPLAGGGNACTAGPGTVSIGRSPQVVALNLRSMLVASMPFDVPDTVALVANQPERFSFQLLPDLRELVMQQLPHEFEHLLGYLLSFAATLLGPKFSEAWRNPGIPQSANAPMT